jgi:glycosyltransferase involved in cell wall biosynthesis
MSKISIIIPTFNVPDYLDECILSILAQQVNFGVEIIIGIDNCEKTLEHIQKNKNLYEKCKVFYFSENVGPYAVKNNLIKESTSDYILFFDSDDIMLNGMLDFFHREIRRADIIRFTFQNFRMAPQKILGVIENAWGVIGVKKGVFKALNDYYGWKCNADVEFVERAINKRFKTITPNRVFFHRREHTYNLTRRIDTGMQSDIRKIYEKEIAIRRETKKWPNPSTEIKNYTNINEIYFT